jgi:hypothetical protein
VQTVVGGSFGARASFVDGKNKRGLFRKRRYSRDDGMSHLMKGSKVGVFE